jgi:hypothetical protein
MTSTNHGIPKLTPTSYKFFNFMALLKMVLLAKVLSHVCDPSAPIVTHPVVKIVKGAATAPNYVPPSDFEQEDLGFNAAALQNHEVLLLIANSLDFSLHNLLKPHPEPPLNVLGSTVYQAIDSHFRQSNELVKQEILGSWESITLTNPRNTYNKITSIFHEGIKAGLEFTPYSASQICPPNPAFTCSLHPNSHGCHGQHRFHPGKHLAIGSIHWQSATTDRSSLPRTRSQRPCALSPKRARRT